MQRLGYTKHGYGYECQGKAKAELFGANHSNGGAKLASSGDSAQLASSGDYAVIAGIGVNNAAKGKIGNWITLAEWEYDNRKSRWVPVCVKTEQIDGVRIKEDTFYKLVDGKFQEV